MKLSSILLLGAAVTIGALSLKPVAPNVHVSADYEYLADFGREVVVDQQGNIYVAGEVTKNATTDHTDMMVIKYNIVLEEQWRRTYDGPVHGNETVTGLALSPSRVPSTPAIRPSLIFF